MSDDLLPHEQHVWLTAFAVALDRKPLDDGHAVRQANLAVRMLRRYMNGDAHEAPAFLYDIYKNTEAT